jgi:hypothetical protein
MLRMLSYEAAVQRLYSLQSNQAVIEAWKAERLAAKNVDLRAETMAQLVGGPVCLFVSSPTTWDRSCWEWRWRR